MLSKGRAVLKEVVGGEEDRCCVNRAIAVYMRRFPRLLHSPFLVAPLQDIMEMVRVHQVSLRGVVSTVVVTTLVLEGWSSKLNPDLQMLQKLKELLPLTWPERVEAFLEAFGSDRPAGDTQLLAV